VAPAVEITFLQRTGLWLTHVDQDGRIILAVCDLEDIASSAEQDDGVNEHLVGLTLTCNFPITVISMPLRLLS
jgi:hypothetical protein